MHNLMHKIIFVPALGLALLALACDTGEGEAQAPRAANAIDPTPQVDADASSSRRAAPPVYASLAEQLAALQPQLTRAGFLRFTDPAVQQPEAAPLLLARLSAGHDAPAVRVALAEAIGRTGADYAGDVSALLSNEADAQVREALVGTLGRRADNEAARPGLLLGLHDASSTVRAAALRSLATRSDAEQFADAIIELLADSDAMVRRDAARTLGMHGVAAAVEPLRARLDDADADVRLHSLRAIARIDASAAASLSSLATLTQDSDPRVQRLARSIH